MAQTAARPDHNIWPLFTAEDALALREWMRKLGFEDGVLVADGAYVQHSEMIWPEGGRVMVCTAREAGDKAQLSGVGNIYVVTANPDRVHDRARDAGIEVTEQLHNTDYGSRNVSVVSPEGHGIGFGTYAGAPPE